MTRATKAAQAVITALDGFIPVALNSDLAMGRAWLNANGFELYVRVGHRVFISENGDREMLPTIECSNAVCVPDLMGKGVYTLILSHVEATYGKSNVIYAENIIPERLRAFYEGRGYVRQHGHNILPSYFRRMDQKPPSSVVA